MNTSFLKDYVQISDFKTIIFIALLATCFYGLILLKKKTQNFSLFLLISLSLGVSLGLVIQVITGFNPEPLSITWVNEVYLWFNLISKAFLNLLKVSVIPVIFFSILKIIINLKSQNIGKTTAKTVGILTATTAFAAVIGIFIGNILKLGSSFPVNVTDATPRETGTIIDTILGILPKNIIDDIQSFNVIGIIIVAFILGYIIKNLDNTPSTNTLKDVINSIYDAISNMVLWIIDYMPFAIITMMSTAVISNGVKALATSLKFILAIYVGCAIMFVVHLILVALKGISPIKYLKAVSPALTLAFTSRSSLATLPVTIKSLTNNLGINHDISSLVGSLGANMGMNGCAGVYPAVAIVTIANVIGQPTNLAFYIALIIIIATGSLGMAGIPGSATIALAISLSGIGFSEYFYILGVVIAVDPIIDMARTLLNVNGTMTTAVLVSSKKQ